MLLCFPSLFFFFRVLLFLFCFFVVFFDLLSDPSLAVAKMRKEARNRECVRCRECV